MNMLLREPKYLRLNYFAVANAWSQITSRLYLSPIVPELCATVARTKNRELISVGYHVTRLRKLKV